jgi:hypothetical protein
LAIRRQYGLSEIQFYGRARLLQLLSNVKAVSDGQADAGLQLSAPMVAAAEMLAQSLRAGLQNRRNFKAQKTAMREERVLLISKYRLVRARIYAFFMENMPEGSRDARLINFGFRPSNLRKKPAGAEKVTVVIEPGPAAAVSVPGAEVHAG